MVVLGRYILITPIIVKEEKSASGMLLSAADSSKTRYQFANVKQVGVECQYVKDGDLISFDSGAGHEVKLNESFFRLILEKDVTLIHEHDSIIHFNH
jgi:co-chaperonin GroES (HSP10)